MIDASPAASVPAPLSSAAEIESSVPPSDAGSDAAVAREDCAPPSRITQLGTIKNRTVFWNDDVLSDGREGFDPETLATAALPEHESVQSTRRDLLVTGERVEQSGATLVAGGRKVGRLAKGERFDLVAAGRFIVVAFGDVEPSFRLVDGLTGKSDPRTYIAASGDLAAFQDDASGITVKNLATHEIALKDIGPCAAGGTWSWSMSPRFLWCDSNRDGRTGHDLRTGKVFRVGQSAFVSPDERYLVRVPGVGWGNDLISEDHVEWTSADTGRTVTLTKDVPRATEEMASFTSMVPVAFCGEGKLFAIVTNKDLVVHRGSDGKRLAAARAMPGGTIEISKSGRYILFRRAGAATVYRLEP